MTYAFYCPDCHREVEETEDCTCGAFVVEVRGSESWHLQENRTFTYQQAQDLARALRAFQNRTFRVQRVSGL